MSTNAQAHAPAQRARPIRASLAGLAAALSATCLAVQAIAAGVARSQKLYDQWQAADRDGDGELSRSEAAAMVRLAPHFDAIDRNRDARISAGEVRAWRRALAAARRKPARDSVHSHFERADADGDGALGRAEALAVLPGLARAFGEADRDGDGRVTREEFGEWIEKRRSAATGR